jgi:DNA-binding transcriptional regulator YhcF (GntR family)
MSKISKIKKKIKGLNNIRKSETFVPIFKFMQDSLGYKCLVLKCAGALAIYIDLAMRYNGVNNGEISYAVRDGKENLGINPNTVGKYLKALERFGFIITTSKGSFDLKKRHASTYELTMWDVIGRHKAKKNFMRYKPTEEEKMLLEKKRKIIPNEYQKTVLNNDIGRYQKTISKASNGHFTVSKLNT